MKKRALVFSAILAACEMIPIGCQSAQTKTDDFGSQMVAYTKQGRYDDAIQVGIKALENKPTDEVVYQQIAIVYLVRAEKDEALREQWVSKAIFYNEKALSLNSKGRDVAGVHVLQEALSFESAGDLSATQRCAYYQRAKKLLTDRIPLLQGEQLTINEKVYPLAPLQVENDKVLTRIQEKAAKAECNEPAESPESIAKSMFPNAPDNRQDINCFRSLTIKMSVNDVVEKCGRPDEELGSGLYIFVWHMPDGSAVSIGTPYLEKIGPVRLTDASGKTIVLPRKK